MAWEYTQLRFVPRGKSWTGEIEELWLDDKQLISRNRPQQVSLVELMNELGSQGWELVTYAQPFTGYHGGATPLNVSADVCLADRNAGAADSGGGHSWPGDRQFSLVHPLA